MTIPNTTVLAAIRNTRVQSDIGGHSLMATERFMEDTRHVIVLDVLTNECPVGEKGQRIRVYLTEAGYQKALQSQERGEMKIIDHAIVRSGHLLQEVPI